jgi:hypothetical protein
MSWCLIFHSVIFYCNLLTISLPSFDLLVWGAESVRRQQIRDEGYVQISCCQGHLNGQPHDAWGSSAFHHYVPTRQPKVHRHTNCSCLLSRAKQGSKCLFKVYHFVFFNNAMPHQDKGLRSWKSHHWLNKSSQHADIMWFGNPWSLLWRSWKPWILHRTQ